MSKLRRRVAAVAASAIAAAGFATSAQPASATISPGVGSWITMSTSSFTLGNLMTCAMTVSGSVQGSRAVGAGGWVRITDASASGCGFGRTMSPNAYFGWDLDMVPISALYSSSVLDGVELNVTVLGATCRYAGTLDALFHDTTDQLVIAQSPGLHLTQGGSACPATPTVTATFTAFQDVTVD